MSATMYQSASNLTMRQYAAIELRVPDSGEEWLDEMIRVSNRIRLFETAIMSGQTDPAAIKVLVGEVSPQTKKAY